MTEMVRIGTRGSDLALWQARHVQRLLAEAHPGLAVEIYVLKTSGDRLKEIQLAGGSAVGFFTKEIEEALLSGQVDLAVHSLKDLPTVLAPGLDLAAVPAREDTRDALVGCTLDELAAGTVVGTGSPRRAGQLKAAFPGIEVRPIRGNVPTRVGLVDEPDGPDAVVLAVAGLKRLELAGRITEVIPHDVMLPAPGQGALGLEIREDDERTRELLAPLDDPGVRAAVTAERAFLNRLEGGCTVPAGALAEVKGTGLLLRGVVADPDGMDQFRDLRAGTVDHPEPLGRALAEQLLTAGGERILLRLRAEER
jgi:hydroxymethylbilane synthase